MKEAAYTISQQDYIKIKHLKKFYSDGPEKVKVLDDLSISFKKDRFYTIFGPNGCGKTTFLNILSGLLVYDQGKISVGGNDPSEITVGYIFQNFKDCLLPWKKVIDNIAFPLEIQGFSRDKRHTLVREKVDELELNIPLNSFPYQLSSGQQQMIVLVRAIVQNPDFFLFDEPFSSLDFHTRLDMEDKILEIWDKQKKTIVFVCHDIEEAIYLSDEIILFSHKPTKILEIIKNDYKRPRSFEFRKTDYFFNLKKRILDFERDLIET